MTPDELIETYLEPDAYRGGPMEWRVKNHGAHVWALVGYLHSTDWDIERTAEDYELPVDAIHAVIEFYKRHKEVIEARIDANTPPAA